MWEQTLYSIVHSVKTALGLSSGTYTYSTTSPIIGPSQGSMGGPAACSTITSPLLTAMDRLAHGLIFTSPDQRVHYATRAKMFIDNNTNYSNDFHRWLATPPTPEALRDLIQHDAQTWERLLWTSGGLLKLEKCLYYLTYWPFAANGTASLTPASKLQYLPCISPPGIPVQPLPSTNMIAPRLTAALSETGCQRTYICQPH
jgi:hypothetical protein